jgi:two-component system, cell cycle sensor histidine kinase and response regulator CckA
MSKARVLIVEDEAIIARDLELLISDLGHHVLATAINAAEVRQVIAASLPDLALLDINLGGGEDGVAIAEQMQNLEIPVIFLTAHSDPATVKRAQAVGPYGYLLKPFNEREVAIAVQLALAKSAADRQIRARAQILQATLQAIRDSVIISDAEGTVLTLNPRAEALTEWPLEQAVGERLATVFPVQPPLPPAGVEPPQDHTSGILTTHTGLQQPISYALAPIVDPRGRRKGVVVAIHERDQLESHALVDTQRMMSLEVLAGSIAHDVNNILTNALGYAQLSELTLPMESEAAGYTRTAIHAVQRAADLNAWLLDYLCKVELARSPLDLNQLVREVAAVLGRKLARHATLELNLYEPLPQIVGDEAQLSQVVLNLLTNAGEAFGAGYGAITVQTRVEELTPAALGVLIFGAQIAAGPHVALRVRDTGVGMDAATITRIFDPYFTTKAEGRGLGLAALLAIVRDHGGALQVQSAPGRGTTFTIYLPAAG